MVCMLLAEPPAFWILQVRFYFVQSAFRAVGSAVAQRGEEVVSGRMIPTLAPLPSIEPPAAEPKDDGAAAEGEPPGELELELEPPQAVRDIAAATPSTASEATDLRIPC